MSTTIVSLSKLASAQEKLVTDPRRIYVDWSRNTREKPAAQKYAAIKQNIDEEGIQTPVKLQVLSKEKQKTLADETGNDYDFELVFGYTRVQIALELTEEHPDRVVMVPFTVVTESLEPVQEFKKNIAENFFRNDLNDIEIGNAILKLENEYSVSSMEEIASMFGKSVAWVTQHKKLVKDLAPEIAKRVVLPKDDPRYIAGSLAMELVTLVKKDDNGDEVVDEETGKPVPDFDQQKLIIEQLEAAAKAAGVEPRAMITRDNIKKAKAGQADSSNGKGGEVKARTAKMIKDFYQLLAETPDIEEADGNKLEDPLANFGKLQVNFIDGKLTDRQMVNRLNKLFSKM